MGKYSEFLSQTPKVSPKIKFEIYTLKRDDEHPRQFYMRVLPLGCKDHCVMYITTQNCLKIKSFNSWLIKINLNYSNATPIVYRQFASINLVVVFSLSVPEQIYSLTVRNVFMSSTKHCMSGSLVTAFRLIFNSSSFSLFKLRSSLQNS